MKRRMSALHVAIAAVFTVGNIYGPAKAATTYTIKRIGVPSSSTSTDATVGGTLDTNQFIYANSSGNVVGQATLYGGSSTYNSQAMWYYSATTGISTPLGLYDSPVGHTTYPTGNVYYQRATSGNVRGNNNISTLYDFDFANSRVYSNGYVVGASRRFDANGNALGTDAWIFNGNGATSTTPSTVIPIPTSVSVPTSSAQSSDLSSLSLSGSPSGFSSNGGNLAYNVPTQNSSNVGGTLQTMGNSTSSPTLQVDSAGHVAGLVSTYYNTTGSTWVQTATDAFYYDGTASKIIGLVNGNNVGTTGVTPFARVSTVTRLNDSDQVLGYSNYYGGATNSSATGIDLWLYDPTNLAATTTANGGNGTQMLAPPSSFASSGNVYAIGTTSLSPTYLTNSGIVGAAFQQFASTDTARANTLSRDTFLYNTHTSVWNQVGLTAAANGSIYTFYPQSNKTGVGGSSFSTVNYSYAPSISESGQAIGNTRRTASPNVALGQDGWVYYPTPVTIGTSSGVPTAGAVPAGTRQIGLYGNGLADGTSPYETNTGSGVYRNSSPSGLTTSGGVIGTSSRYINNTSFNTAGIDAWIYDPAHGITTTKLIGLTDSIHQTFDSGATNVTETLNSFTAIGSQDMVAGTCVRYSSANLGTSTGSDAWVFDPTTDHTYNVEAAGPNSSIDADRTHNFAASIQYISDSGVAVGYDSTTLTNTGSSANNYNMFDWYLAYDSATGLKDIPTFNYLISNVDPASLAAGDWSKLFAANTTGGAFLPSTMTADGDIIGVGDISDDSTTSIIPFQLSPAPEPSSLGLLLPGVAMLIACRKTRIARRMPMQGDAKG